MKVRLSNVILWFHKFPTVSPETTIDMFIKHQKTTHVPRRQEQPIRHQTLYSYQ